MNNGFIEILDLQNFGYNSILKEFYIGKNPKKKKKKKKKKKNTENKIFKETN